MTQRERSSPDSGSRIAPRSPADLAALLSPLLLTASSSSSLWEQWYEQASPTQRQQALARAGEQGFLFAHHLSPPEGPHFAGSRRSLLTALLHGPAPELEPVRCSTLQPIDCELDEVQRQAVASVLASPDVALILGYPGAGKSRVVAEVLRQSVQAGQRVLLLAPTTAALDTVLGRLARESDLAVIRRLAGDETVEGLSAGIAALTLEQRLRTFEEKTLPAARRAVDACAAALEACRRSEPAWEQWEECLQQQERLHEGLCTLGEQRQGLLAALEAELDHPGDSPLQIRWREARQACDEAVAQADARLADVHGQVEQLAAQQRRRDVERQDLAPLAEAKQGHRWWSSAWWRATLHGSKLQRLEQLQAESHQAEQQLHALQATEQKLLAERAQRLAERTETRASLRAAAHASRDAELAEQQAALSRQQEQAAQTWQSLLSQSGGPALSDGPPRQALQAARETWATQRRRVEQDLTLREQWLRALQQTLPGLPAYLASAAQIVAATTASLPSDAVFGDRASPTGFDLLIVEEAHRLSDSELLTFSRRARRWLLIGEVPVDLPVPSSPSRRSGPARPRPVQPRPAFQRLWNLLHPDPRRLPVRWRISDGKLIVSLRPLAPEQEPWVQNEPVFDRPEIELRIVAPPRQEPQIAEVAFPASTSVAAAKEFIYRELQELSVQSSGPALRWCECERCVTLEFGAGSGGATVSTLLEPGVHELATLVPRPGEGEAPCQTGALVFDRADGWDRMRAERWVAERLGLRDSGRTSVLARSYRAREPLARFLSGLLYEGRFSGWDDARAECLNAVELIPVPAAPRADLRRGNDSESRWSGGGTATLATRARALKEGAGLEIDLADPRRVETLPADLRASLPAQGVVNLAEARAVVAMLETLVGDPAFASASKAQGTLAGPAVAVISLFPAQVELLRLLIQRSPLLAASPTAIEVGLPGVFHQREALVVLISLTRSHLSRAVPFCDSPQALLLALTRPIARLVLFGDPGTMVRRSQWHGGLDHLDEIAGPLEQSLIAQLVGCLTEPDIPARNLRSRESSSA